MDGMNYKRRKISITPSLLNLDDDILVSIFTRLPITTILGCKRVCKSWYLFISSSYFANSYRSNPPFTSLIVYDGNRFALLELNTYCNYSVKPNTLKILSNPFETFSWQTMLSGSCNGFLCLTQKDLVNVWNPLTGMSFMLPSQRLDKCKCPLTTSYGFGFCPKTRQYKVVEIAKYGRSSRTELNVFTLGIDKSWRRLIHENAPLPRVASDGSASWADYSMQFFEVNGKGALHWIVNKMDIVDYLYSFDISEEKVRPVPTPLGLKKRKSYTKSVFLHGCLGLLHMNQEENIEFWCMNDYMVPDSWTLRIITQTCIPRQMRYRWFHTVSVWKDEEVLLALKSNFIHYYNLKHEHFTKIKLELGDTSPKYNVAACFVPNFLPFFEAGTAVAQTQDVVKGQGLLILEDSKLTELVDGSAGIMKLPTFILENIFSRVPVNTILCCKGVCKVWYKFLSDPCFAKTYYMLKRAIHLVLCNETSVRFLFELKVDADNSVKANKLLAISSLVKITTILGSCNGLICMSALSYPEHVHRICICNPLMQELAILPQAREVKGMQDEAYGFGFSSVTGHYKILRIWTEECHHRLKTKAQVHTVGIDKGWREVHGNFRMPKKWPSHINRARFCDVSFNRAIHWIVDDSKAADFICAFDIDDEQVKSVLAPPIMGYINSYTWLGFLRDCFCVFHPRHINIEIWWMNTCGLVTSWTKEIISVCRITLPFPLLKQLAVLPITSWRDGEILLWIKGGTLISYCSREKRCTEIDMDDVDNEVLIAVPYVQSFLSLRASVKNCHLEVNRCFFC